MSGNYIEHAKGDKKEYMINLIIDVAGCTEVILTTVIWIELAGIAK